MSAASYDRNVDNFVGSNTDASKSGMLNFFLLYPLTLINY